MTALEEVDRPAEVGIEVVLEVHHVAVRGIGTDGLTVMMTAVTEMILGTSEMTDGGTTTGTAMINVIIREEMLRGMDETTTGETEVLIATVEGIAERIGMKERLALARHPRALVMVCQGHLQVHHPQPRHKRAPRK